MSIFDEKSQRTELSELGEFGLIERITRDFPLQNKTSIKGVGDDCAVIRPGDKEVLVTKDLLIEGVHFDMTYMPLKHLGYKAAVVNISDIVAMNGKPTQLLVGLGITNRFSVEALDELYEGIRLACKKYQVDMVGGDTVSSLSGLFLSITAIGEVSKDGAIYRNTAKKGDLLCVSGDLGAAYMGLMILEREKQEFKGNPNMQPDLEGHDYILGRQLKPEARTDVVESLKKAGIKPTAMIDISDGLASEALHIATGSGLAVSIYEDKIPIDMTTDTVSRELNIDPSIAALNGGEDYELLFTISQSDFEKIKMVEEVSVIGHMTDKNAGFNLITRSGTQIPLNAQGWDAFLKKNQQPNKSNGSEN